MSHIAIWLGTKDTVQTFCPFVCFVPLYLLFIRHFFPLRLFVRRVFVLRHFVYSRRFAYRRFFLILRVAHLWVVPTPSLPLSNRYLCTLQLIGWSYENSICALKFTWRWTVIDENLQYLNTNQHPDMIMLTTLKSYFIPISNTLNTTVNKGSYVYTFCHFGNPESFDPFSKLPKIWHYVPLLV